MEYGLRDPLTDHRYRRYLVALVETLSTEQGQVIRVSHYDGTERVSILS